MAKRTAGYAAAASARWNTRSAPPTACILVYHRVANIGFVDPDRDDWNVPPDVFERQIRALAESTNVVSLAELTETWDHANSTDRPTVCITFDDGFANFHQHAVPILERYQTPATLFVPTSAVGTTVPMPFDRWAHANQARVEESTWRAITWPELESCLNTGLITIGSHSHRHLNAAQTAVGELEQEVTTSWQILRARLGSKAAPFYAFPYGSTRLGQVPPEYVDAVRQAGLAAAVTTDLSTVGPDHDRFRLPRIEAHQLDSPAVILAKSNGYLYPYRVTDWFRKSRRG